MLFLKFELPKILTILSSGTIEILKKIVAISHSFLMNFILGDLHGFKLLAGNES